MGALALLFLGPKLVVPNWRLTLVQTLQAMLIWATMLDLKAHALKGPSFHTLRGPVLIPLVLFIAALTAGGYLLDAVLAFCISGRDSRFDRRSTEAMRHRRPVFGVARRHRRGARLHDDGERAPGRGWFTLLLGTVVAVMMATYVAIPSTLVGVRVKRSPRERITTTALSGQ